MSIDFMMPANVLEVRDKIRAFIKDEIDPAEKEIRKTQRWREGIGELRRKAKAQGLWCPHMPPEFGGMRPQPARLVHPQRAGARRRQHAYDAALRDAGAEGKISASVM